MGRRGRRGRPRGGGLFQRSARREHAGHHGRPAVPGRGEVRVLRPGGIRPPVEVPQRHPAGARGQAVGADAGAGDGGHRPVRQARRRLPPVLLQRVGGQPVAAGRLEDDAGGGEAAQGDHQVHRPRRRGQGRQADQRHRVLRLPGLQRPHRLPEHHRDPDPAVEAACATKVPVIVFDRGVTTDCPVTFIHPIGGFAFGADGAEFLKEKVKPGGNILALRILPGVDVLEQRWAAANEIFAGSELKVVGVEFTDGDAAKTKSIVSDYIQRVGKIDGVWMDAGATAVAAVEAFQDAGAELPAIVGEDQQDFLRMWADEGLTAVAPTYPTYQWRTPVIAAVKILKGEQVPSEWVLPQPKITQDTVQQYVKQDMPPLHYAMCGCETMSGYPGPWK
ncbi:substrate-binding domain-containing protein [Actinokineospora soli]|uniref:Substrate-binding domain-containing protein n=1 Tax=Actinokineospora soli TaxID=1048753 RepID=A0ABW2TPC3_9PSEU